MKFIATFLLAACVLTVQGAPTKESVQKWMKAKTDCLAETKISEDKVKTLEAERTIPEDEEVHEFVLCVSKKEGSITEDGTFDKKIVMEEFSEVLGDVEGPKIAEKCSTDQGNAKANAVQLVKCYFEHVTKEQEDA